MAIHTPVNIMWFRQDLRLEDNPALTAAAGHGAVLPLFILDDMNAGPWSRGSASRWWLHHSLSSLNCALQGTLLLLRGDPRLLLPELLSRLPDARIFWNRCYEPWRVNRDTQIKADLRAKGAQIETFKASLLWEPWEVKNSCGGPYQVFTAYYRRTGLMAAPARPIPTPPLELVDYSAVAGTSCSGPFSAPASVCGAAGIEALDLLSSSTRQSRLQRHWTPGEADARRRLAHFIDSGLHRYKERRDYPGLRHVSRLSASLHFGELSPRQVWHQIHNAGLMYGLESDADCFLHELGWREFSWHLLYHKPDLPRCSIQARFDNFPWRMDAEALTAWQQGRTGFPLIDAGMRELLHTGHMHNRVRMVAASFLVKNLRIHWHHGEDWFWQRLLDADLASNSVSWQWVAGCGADAAPYFRIFNPVTQSRKFDPEGHYIRRYVPELAKLPERYLHNPSAAPEAVLATAGITLGKTYPRAIADLKSSREEALLAYKAL